MSIQNDILSTTLRILKDEAVDNLHRTTPLLKAIEDAGNIEKVDGGQKYDLPVILSDHSSVTQLSGGYEPVSLSVSDVSENGSWEWCDFVAPINISKKEELSNKSDKAIVRIAEMRMTAVLRMMKRDWERRVIAGTGPLSDLDTFNGLGTATGWFEELAFGSQTNSVGGISKASFPTSWQHQVGDASSAFATNGLRAMSSVFIQAQTYAPSGSIDLVLASPTSYELYKDTLQTQERYMSASEQPIDGGVLALAYNGAKMLISPDLGYAGSGGNDASMLFLNSDFLHVIFDKDAYFELSDFEHVTGFNSRSAQMQVRTAIAASHLASHGILLNGEA